MFYPEKIFSAGQIKEADKFTIHHEPIASIDLMERAALKSVDWIRNQFPHLQSVHIFCGPGNNGGDGLAIARLLFFAGVDVQVYIINQSKKYSADFLTNESQFRNVCDHTCHIISSISEFPEMQSKDVIIDAIFGSGLNKPVFGLSADVIGLMNQCQNKIVSIDIPSGLFGDCHSNANNEKIKADYTLGFQFAKLAYLFPENAACIGEWKLLNIGINETFINHEPTSHYLITHEYVKSLFKPRKKFSHKGNFGHALLIAGSYGKMGAAILGARSCLRSGVGLLTIHSPKCGYEILQSSVPEAMILTDTDEQFFTNTIVSNNVSTIGVGPGIGTNPLTAAALHFLLSNIQVPLILDADALNILGLHKEWLSMIPTNSILTPHLKEFERIAGKSENDFERHQLQIDFSKKYKVYVVLKGAHTCITTPLGDSYFNTTGNSGMAKGGSGDILTGILTALLAQGYPSLETCLIAVYIHGLAGDLAKQKMGEIGMIPSDLIECLPAAFLQFSS